MPVNWLPSERLKDKPTVKSLPDTELALAELAAISSRRKGLQAQLDAEIQRIRAQHNALLEIESPSGKTVRMDEREQQLSEAIGVYCSANRDEFISTKKKSRDFPHGTIGFKDAPPKLDYEDGEDEKSVLAKLLERGTVQAINAVLDSLSWFGARMGLFVTFTLKLNKSGLLAAWKKDEVTENQIKKAGLKIQKPGETVTIKLNDYQADKAA